jgi:starch phosphorylase
MKSAMNGGINCSVLDGWWDECFTPEAGWAISSAEDATDLDRRNVREADSLFELLENQVVPRYYDDRVPGNASAGWADTMRHSVELGRFVSSARMVRDYVTELYEPAARAAAALASDGYAGARELSAWQSRVLDGWHGVHVDEVELDESIADLSATRTVTARVSLGELDPADVQVQLLSGLVGQAGELEDPTVTAMSPVGADGDRHLRFEAKLCFGQSGRAGITVRVVPDNRLIGDPLDLGRVAWAG